MTGVRVYERKCERCGSRYEIRQIKIIMRDKDELECDVCHAVMVRWNGAVMYVSKLLEAAPWPTEASTHESST